MKFWVGTTDNGWYDYISTRGLDEVNFWQPGARPPFTNAPVGLPFLFKLRRPNNHIAGGGFFVAYSTLPISVAWDVFGEKNGASSLAGFHELLGPLNHQRLDGEVGCTVLANVSFLPRELWIDPAGWSPNIVRGKMYESTEGAGDAIWREYSARSAFKNRDLLPKVADEREKYGSPILVKPRIGQASFRILVTNAYKKRCAITGENTLIALEAAHIVPYSTEGTHEVSNGMLLRADFHKLYDVGLVGVTPDLRIKISPRIRESYFNGKAYYRMDGKELEVIPDLPEQRPDPDRLNWHMQNRFQK
jgi:putative restriction endonuclease